MKSAISDLWNGNIAPSEHCGAHDQTANTLHGQVKRIREILSADLTGEQKALLEQFDQLWEDYLLRMMDLAFRDGFVIGGRLAAEVCSVR